MTSIRSSSMKRQLPMWPRHRSPFSLGEPRIPDGLAAAPSQSIFTVLDETMSPVGHVLRASDHHRSRTASACAQPVTDRGSLLAVPVLVRLSLAIRKRKKRSGHNRQNKRSLKGWRIRQGYGCNSAYVFDADRRSNPLTLLGSKGPRFHSHQQSGARPGRGRAAPGLVSAPFGGAWFGAMVVAIRSYVLS